MKVTDKELRRIIREERDRLLSEQNNTLDRFLTGEYTDYQHGQPEDAARRIKEAIRMLVSATKQELPTVGGALEPGFKKAILETIIADFAAEGIRLK
tara:strand:+ start:460 stop:750 length:291 start_codon:yes stop_codon:yes gene_type:complete